MIIQIKIIIYNTTGQLVGAKYLSPDNAKDTGSILFNGSSFNSGIYYYSLIVDEKRMDTKSMLLIK